MSKNNNIEQELDGLFKNTLENASSQVPPGVWESVSSSIGTSAGVASAASIATKSMVWMKAGIAALSIAAISTVAYIALSDDKKPEPVTQIENSIENLSNEIVQAENELKNVDLNENSTEIQQNSNKPAVTESNKAKDNKAESVKMNRNPFDSLGSTGFGGDKKHFNLSSKKLWEQYPLGTEDKPETDKAKKEVQSSKDTSEKFVEQAELPKSVVIDSCYKEFPNVFTPNGDGINDCYAVRLVGEESFIIQIYDISMNKLFETKNKYKTWCCVLPNGEQAASGTYIVRISYKFKGQKEKVETFKLTVIK